VVKRDESPQWADGLALPAGVVTRAFFDSLNQGVMIVDPNGVILDLNVAALEIMDTERDALVGHTIADLPPAVDERGEPLTTSERPVAQVLRDGDPITMRMIGLDLPRHGRRWIMVHDRPLRVDGRVAGASSSFIDITSLRRATATSDLFAEVNRSMMHERDEKEFLARFCDALVTIGGYELAALGEALVDERHSVRLLHAAGATHYLDALADTATWSQSSDTGRGALGTALRTGLVQISHELPNYPSWSERAEQVGFRSMIALPLTLGHRSAVLVLYAREPLAFRDETVVARLTQMTDEISFGVAHLTTTRQLADSLEGTLRALAHLTEIRDPFTADHQNRVAQLAAAIALDLGLDEELVHQIYQSGLVLDIGKSSVPAEILTRPGHLTPLEFSMVQRHCEIGAAILEHAHLPDPIISVARQHHERLDGSGYPDGLRGDEISLAARVVMVADVLEAMTQHRPYRPARRLEEALDHVRENSGRLFDPAVVTALDEVFARGFTFDDTSWSASPLGAPLIRAGR
jgi:PAS domain S-box-containing protein